MITDTFCGHCGEPIYNEDSADRQPCPKCGSTKRKYNAKLTVTVSASVTATAQVFRPASAFLDVAHTLANSGDRTDWNLCVVATLVACEIATEKTIVEVAKASGQNDLVDLHRDGDRTFKMQEKKTRVLYGQLTCDDIEEDWADWGQYLKDKDLRNDIVHEGRQTDQETAKEFLRVATDFVRRLEKHKPTS